MNKERELLRRTLVILETANTLETLVLGSLKLEDDIRTYLASEPEDEPFAWAWDEIMSDGIEPVADIDKPIDNEYRTNIRPFYLHPPRPKTEDEPVAWVRLQYVGAGQVLTAIFYHPEPGAIPFYTRPESARKPMTVDEMRKAWDDPEELTQQCLIDYCRAIEKHHGIGE
jgi:hypothetical protein